MTTDEMVAHLRGGKPLAVRTVPVPGDARPPVEFTITSKLDSVFGLVRGYGVNGRNPFRLLTPDELHSWCARLETITNAEETNR